jgi:hypothetical protein
MNRFLQKTMDIKSVFKDVRLNELFSQQGYVVVPFLYPEEVRILTDFYFSGEKEKREQFTTFAANDYHYRKSVHEQIQNSFLRPFIALFNDYIPFWGNFFSKPGGSPALLLHADPQYVNEPDQISLNIWCPLVDAFAENGALGVVPHSHRLLKQIRGTNITDAYRKNAVEIQQKFGKLLEVRAGDAVIYDHRLLHYSLPNKTDNPRLVATMVTVPKGAPVLNYYAEKEGDSTVIEYAINSVEDFLKTGFLKRPQHLQPVKVFNYDFNPLAVNDFNALNKSISTENSGLNKPAVLFSRFSATLRNLFR